MHKRSLVAVLAATLLLVLTGCAEPEPELIEVTREVEVLQTVEVPQTVAVTREVTRIVEQTVEVEVVVTATFTPTPVHSPTPTPRPSPSPTTSPVFVPKPDVSTSLLQAMRTTRTRMDEFGGLLDEAVGTGVLRCTPTVELYDAIVGAPAFDVTGSSEAMQWAYGRYREAIGIFSDQSRGLAEQCRNPDSKDIIEAVGWTRARKSVQDALTLLIPAIDELE